MSDEKTEDATPKKLQDARKKGQSVKSPDVNAAAGLLAATMCLVLASSASADRLSTLLSLVWERALFVQTHAEMQALALEMCKQGVALMLPFVAAAVVVGLVVSFAQVGFVISMDPLSPDVDKVNPASGLKRVFSVRSLVDFAKMLLKAVAVGAVVTMIVIGLLPLLVSSSAQSPSTIGTVAFSSMVKLCGAATLVFTVMGPLDYALQRWLFMREQRMSKDEVKREYKEMEGDPIVKGRRRQLAHELAHSDPRQRVPGATVVVTNPTHYAVALYFKPGETPLPLVVAKGVEDEAARIRELAQAHRVPMVGNPPLARALHQVPVDDPIPEPLFEAVASVLRWVALIDGLSAGVAQGGDPSRAP